MNAILVISILLAVAFSPFATAQAVRENELSSMESIAVDVPYKDPVVPEYWEQIERTDYALGHKAAWQYGIREKYKVYRNTQTGEIVCKAVAMILRPEKASPALLLGYRDGAEEAERDFRRFVSRIDSIKEKPNKPLQGTEGTVPSSSTEPEALRP